MARDEVRIEPEHDHLLVIFPGPRDNQVIRWQEAEVLGAVLEQAAADIAVKRITPVQPEFERLKLEVGHTPDKKHVVLLFAHSDRLRLSYEGARTLGRVLKLKAQDLYLLGRGVHMKYGVPGREGRPTPFWDASRFPKTLKMD